MVHLFDEFIAKKRKVKEITLRNMVKGLVLRPSYYSDIEKSRRNRLKRTR